MKKLRFIGLLVVAVAFSTVASAQVGDLQHNFSVGVNAGLNLTSAQFSPTVRQNQLSGIVFGVTGRYISEKYFGMTCGIRMELNYSQHGWKEFVEGFDDLQFQRTLNYVDIPFLAHLAFGKKFQFFIDGGPQIGFYLSDKSKISGDWDSMTGVVVEQHTLDVKHKFDYGITGGLGFELKTRKAGNFLLEGRYYYALSDFFGNEKQDYFGRSANTTISIKLTYLFDITK
ncbi:MAG: PorT family protein [Bacteroidaceae bacterium]|nr:PorT family protein [Bacteroidaceae bacterium]